MQARHLSRRTQVLAARCARMHSPMYGAKCVMAAGFEEKVLTCVGKLAGDGNRGMQDACGVFWTNHAVPFAARSYVHVGRAWSDLQPTNVPQDFLASSDEVAEAGDLRNVWGENVPLGQFRANDIVCTDVAAQHRSSSTLTHTAAVLLCAQWRAPSSWSRRAEAHSEQVNGVRAVSAFFKGEPAAL